MRSKLLTLVSLCVLLMCAACAALAAEPVTALAPVADIKSYGNVTLKLSPETMQQAGYAPGDLVDVAFGQQVVTMPYGTNYTDVDGGCPVLVYRRDKSDHVLAISNGSFAEFYGLAEKTDTGWSSPEGDAVTVTITMNTPGGYLDQYTLRSLSYTDERGDYPELSDAGFANFREVTTPGIARGVLYRSASPVDNRHNRAAYAAAEFEAAGIRVVLNLANSEETLQAFESYPGSYYSNLDVVAMELGMDMTAPDNMYMLASELRFMLAHDGPVCIHCLEGKDRTGFVCAVLERLAGASADELLAEYMVTYSNYYGLTPDSETYAVIRAGFDKSLVQAMGEDLDAADYLKRCGLTDEEISAVAARLSQ